MEALQPDNVGYVESEVRDNVLFFRMSADNAGTLRNTADDLIACLKIAEDAVGMTPRDLFSEDVLHEEHVQYGSNADAQQCVPLPEMKRHHRDACYQFRHTVGVCEDGC